MPSSAGDISEARKTIQALVDRYARNRHRYGSSSYNEETCRAEFITPLFEALGWDVTNEAGDAEQYKDVIHEEGIKVGDFTKAPDYTFRIGGARKFFVEAKKPSVDLKSDPAPAYQLRRYAWSAKLSLSVLTDFEEIVVYDTRIRPKEGEKPSVARILYITYDELPTRFNELWDVFSKDAVRKGSFDRYADDTKGKRGTSEVDAEFLKEIEGWRDDLARNIAIRNEDLSADDLNFSVQTTIDRIIFLRIAEGRGAEPYGNLLGLVNGADIYKRLVAIYRKADARYNSGLFDFKSDRLTTGLTIDDKVLKPILQNLYYPQSPYEFSVLPVEILGNVYEQFLGKVIRLTKGHQAKVEEKPEVKKAGGVYYTPAYIVDYIVQHTLGQLCDGKSPKQMEKLRVLDPACGSGSFLLKAYQELLDRHLVWYREHQPEKQQKAIFRGPGEDWRLTTVEKRRIVLNNIYGVDIDRQAVEVTKLSLLLKILEGENDESIQQQQTLYGERALPSLEDNIKCGNSLIAPQDLGELARDPDELRRINPFAWKDEFREVFRDGGFDVVIGNPPYIRIQTMQEWAPLEVELYKSLYRSGAIGNYDIYVVFVEKGLSVLNPRGRLGYILPHKFFNAKYGEALRGLISDGKHLRGIVHFGDQQVFAGATTYTCLLFLDGAGCNEVEVSKVKDLDEWRTTALAEEGVIPSSGFSSDEWHLNLGSSGMLVEKLYSMTPTLGDIAHLFVGVQTDADDVFILEKIRTEGSRVLCLSKATAKEHWLESDHVRAFLKGSLNIGRYCFKGDAKLLIFPYSNNGAISELIPQSQYAKKYPLTWAYLRANKERLVERNKGRMGDAWHGYVYKKNHVRMTQRKLLVPSLANGSAFSADPDGKFFFAGSGGGGGGGYGITPSVEGLDSFYYLLGVLNSKVLSYLLRETSTPFRGGYFALNRQYIERMPILGLDDLKTRQEVATLAEQAVSLRRKLDTSRSPQDQVSIARQIAANDEKIDRLMFAVYGLSSSEIGTVEGQTSS